MSFTIVETDTPGDDLRDAILAPLRRFNAERMGRPLGHRLLGLAIVDPASGEVVGGLWGESSYDWMFVELLYVPPELRGQKIGARLLARAEAVARERGCVGVWLDTFDFQARGFYEKHGYAVCGHIDDYPRGHGRWFLQKRIG